MGEHAFDQPIVDEGVHQRLRRASGKNVQIAAGLTPTPEAAHHRDLCVRRVFAQRSNQRRSRVMRLGREPPAGESALFFESFQDERFFLCAHSFHVADASVARRRVEVLERANSKFAVEPCDSLGPDALKMQQVEDGRRKFLQQLLVIAHRAGLDQLADLRGDVLADARQRQALGRRHLRHSRGLVRNGLAGIPVRPDLERVLPFDLEEVADLGEDARNG